jgi:hypothetical protein
MLENALQGEKQETEQKRGNPRWVKGVSQNPRGRESKAARQARREAVIAAWAEPYGGVAALKPAELDLLYQAAELSLVRPRTVEDQVRVANTISKILAQVGFADKHRKREPAGPDLRAQFRAAYGLRASEELEAEAAMPIRPLRQLAEADTDSVIDDATATPAPHASGGEEAGP